MKKIALLATFVVTAAVALVACPNGVTTCTTDADCTSATTDGVADPVCESGTCVPVQCTNDEQCLVDDAGASASCASDSDCTTAGDKCLSGSNDTGHCVTEQKSTDPACTDTQFTGKDVDGSDVDFCDTTGPSCDSPGKCSGVSG